MIMAPNTPASTSLPQKRQGVSDKERFQIRKHYKDHSGSQASLIQWFYQQSGHKLNQSQISRILSSKYNYLDETTQKKVKDQQRASSSEWPDLEIALFEWQQRMEKKNAVITGDILKLQAKMLWEALPQYHDQDQPKWSNGWLDNFKKRFKIKEYVKCGEGSSAQVNNPENITQMEKVCQLAAEYGEDNTLNMDETGLFWKLVPDRTLATKSGSGGKKSKDRVTLALTCSASGEKLQPWLIGRSKNPRCFKKINKTLFRVHYRYNKTKWMTGLIMEEYLRWLDNKMRSEHRKVLLLLDNFSGHELGVKRLVVLRDLAMLELNGFLQIQPPFGNLWIRVLLHLSSFSTGDSGYITCFNNMKKTRTQSRQSAFSKLHNGVGQHGKDYQQRQFSIVGGSLPSLRSLALRMKLKWMNKHRNKQILRIYKLSLHCCLVSKILCQLMSSLIYLKRGLLRMKMVISLSRWWRDMVLLRVT
jgi:hypothetical protein